MILEIWQPRYKDNTVLLAQYKVDACKEDEIDIKFTKAKHLEGIKFFIKKSEAQKYPMCDNGRISCYEVPFNMLEVREE